MDDNAAGTLTFASIPDGPSPGRVVTLTDAVVALAMTLLVLPLVDTAGGVDTAHLGDGSVTTQTCSCPSQ